MTTLDVMDELRPNIVGSVFKLPFRSNSFDVGMCCQVLEHLPFENFQNALTELHRVCRSHLILSLPDVSGHFGIKLETPLSLPQIFFSVPSLISRPHIFDGYHYWEIGKQGYELQKIRKVCGFDVKKTLECLRIPITDSLC